MLALTSALLIAGTASLTLDERRQVAETESGVQTMTELDSRASLVALEGGDAATIDVRSRAGDGRVSVDDGGEIRFVMRDNNSITWRENATLGTVTYANGNRRIAYQGGGVWRSTAGTNGSVMVSPPEVNYKPGFSFNASSRTRSQTRDDHNAVQTVQKGLLLVYVSDYRVEKMRERIKS